MPNHLAIFIHALQEARAARIAEYEKIDRKEALSRIAKYDKERRKYHDYYAAGTWGNAAFYDLTINSSILGVGGTVELVCSFVRQAESGRERQA
jgi:cytidylate kinase